MIKSGYLAGLLVLTAMPAQAAHLEYEAEGYGQIVTGTPGIDEVVRWGVLRWTGIVDQAVSSGFADAYGFGVTYSDGIDYFSLSFGFADVPLADPFDWQWHDGLGFGFGSTSAFAVNSVEFSRARLRERTDEPGGSISISTPVPEPASWALLIAGMALTGGVMRRRSTAAAFA